MAIRAISSPYRCGHICQKSWLNSCHPKRTQISLLMGECFQKAIAIGGDDSQPLERKVIMSSFKVVYSRMLGIVSIPSYRTHPQYPFGPTEVRDFFQNSSTKHINPGLDRYSCKPLPLIQSERIQQKDRRSEAGRKRSRLSPQLGSATFKHFRLG